MQQAHGIGYAEYSRNLESRIKVERERQADFEKSQQVLAEIERKVHR